MLDSFKESLLIYCYWVGDYLKRVLVVVSVSAFAISIAVSFYGAFYYAVLPSTAINIPVRFRFSSCSVIGQPCSYVTASIHMKDKKLVEGKRYNLELILDVPDSSSNREVGMFLTCTTFIAKDLEPHVSPDSCVAALVPFQPIVVSIIKDILLLPLLLSGLTQANTAVGINLLDTLEGSKLGPSTTVQLEIQTSRLQIQSGVLKIWSNDLVGIRNLMYHHPLISMILGVTSILTVGCLLSALALSRFLAPHRVVQAGVRTKSNHDLADRQARARLSLEYRQEMSRRKSGNLSGVQSILAQPRLGSISNPNLLKELPVQEVEEITTNSEPNFYVQPTNEEQIIDNTSDQHQKLE